MKFPAWVFITEGEAIAISAQTIKDATFIYLTDWNRKPYNLQIVPLTGSG